MGALILETNLVRLWEKIIHRFAFRWTTALWVLTWTLSAVAYRELKGNLFASNAQTLVNTVNCVGAMGKGVALEFRLRFPKMFVEYQRVCAAGKLHPGQIWPYRKERPWILNFAVKDDWRYPSRIEWVESCLQKFVENYRQLGLRSVAMPWLGAMNGRLDWPQVQALIRSYLAHLDDIDIELIEFDLQAPDPWFEHLGTVSNRMDVADFAQASGLTETAAQTILRAVRTGQAKSLAEVTALDSLGKLSIERLYAFLGRSTTVVSPSAIAMQSQLL